MNRLPWTSLSSFQYPEAGRSKIGQLHHEVPGKWRAVLAPRRRRDALTVVSIHAGLAGFRGISVRHFSRGAQRRLWWWQPESIQELKQSSRPSASGVETA